MSRRQRVTETRTQQFGAELSDGMEHLRSAATIAAESAAGAVAPRVDTAREALVPRVMAAREVVAPRVESARQVVGRSWDSTMNAVAPVVTAAAESARRATDEARKQAGKKARKASRAGRTRHRRWPWVVGALALGVAAGTVAALLARRNAPDWEEYEPEHQFAGPADIDEPDDPDEATGTAINAEHPDGSGSAEEAKRAASAHAKSNGTKES